MINGAGEAGFQIIWGKTMGESNPFLSFEGLKANVKDHLKSWNSKANPRRREKPTIIILHDYRDHVFNRVDEIVAEMRSKGFVLVDFDKDKADNDPDYYQ